MKNISIDLKDKKILYQLDVNARQSNAQIAKKVGLSKEVVNYRIKRLESEGIIKGYHAVINFWRLGYKTIRVYIKLIDASPIDRQNIVDSLVKNPLVLFVLKTEGEFDIGFGIMARNLLSFESFFHEIEKQFKQFIIKKHISIYTRIYHFHRAYFLDKKIDNSETKTIQEESLISYDDKDISILKLIANNSRIHLLEISKKLRIAPKTIAYRIRQMEKKKVIISYKAILNISKIGLESYKIDIFVKNIKKLDEMIAYCHNNPNITFIVQTIGGADLEFGIEIDSKERLNGVLEEMRKKFEDIRTIDYSNTANYEKYTYFLQ